MSFQLQRVFKVKRQAHAKPGHERDKKGPGLQSTLLKTNMSVFKTVFFVLHTELCIYGGL